jgi:hypothetical protein
MHYMEETEAEIILKHIDIETVEDTSPTLYDVFLHFTGRNIKKQPGRGIMERYALYD